MFFHIFSSTVLPPLASFFFLYSKKRRQYNIVINTIDPGVRLPSVNTALPIHYL